MRLTPLACLALIGCTPASAVETPPATLHEVRIIDGDTFTLDGETIRIANIDAPESAPRAKCWAEARLAVEAKRALEERAGAWHLLPPTVERQGRDRYGRTVALVTDAAIGDVGDDLVKGGLAVPWLGRRWAWCEPTSADPGGERLLDPAPAPSAPFVSR